MITFENGTKSSEAYVTISGVKHYVTPAQYTGKTPLNATNLNKNFEELNNQIKANFEELNNQIKANFEELNNSIKSISADSGWIKITNLESNFQPYENNENFRPAYRKIGKIVFIQGEIAPKSDLAKDTTYVMFTLPEGYRPSKDQKMLCQGSANRIWLLQIDTKGKVYLSRYREGADSVPPYSSNWFPFNISFCI